MIRLTDIIAFICGILLGFILFEINAILSLFGILLLLSTLNIYKIIRHEKVKL